MAAEEEARTALKGVGAGSGGAEGTSTKEELTAQVEALRAVLPHRRRHRLLASLECHTSSPLHRLHRRRRGR